MEEMTTLDEIDTSKDKYMLGLHLYLEHQINDPDTFDRLIKFGIVDICNPADIEKKEYWFMHQLNTFQPSGINIEYPFGIPLFLDKNDEVTIWRQVDNFL